MKARTNFLVACAASLLGPAGPLLALDKIVPPKIESSWGGISWLYVFVGLIGICAVAFKNSRRTHLH